MQNKVSSIIFSTAINNKQLRKDLEKTKRQIEELEKEIAIAESARLPYLEQSKQLAKQLDLAKGKLHEMQNAVAGSFSAEQITEQSETVKALQARFDDVQRTVERYDRKIRNATDDLKEAETAAGDIEKELTTAGYNAEKMSDAIKKADKNAERFKLRMREVARSALVFSLITQALSEFKEWMVLVVKTNDEATAAMARLKAALLTLAQPLVGVVIPAFTALVNILTTVVTVAGRVMAALFGKTYEESQKAAQALNKETSALEGIGSAANEAAGSLAGFDEINTLATETASAGTSLDYIVPDFSGIQELPEMLESILADIELKISEIRVSWDKGEILKNKDAWIVGLSAILGAIFGTMFGGFSGGVIGLLLGASVGLVSVTFFDELDNPDEAKDLFLVVLGAMLGAVLGGIFGGIWGAAIGLLLGAAITITYMEFKKGDESTWGKEDTIMVVLSAILGAMLGGLFGGIWGAAIGLLLGAVITITYMEFRKGDESTWDKEDTIIMVLSAILGAILGGLFGGIWGTAIGFLLGAAISFAYIEFSEGDYNKSSAKAALRIVVLGLLGAIAGSWFGGPVGAGIGLLIGLTIAFSDVGFDESMDARVRSAAQKALKVAVTTIIGALIGAVFGGGVFGGIVGGAIGLVLGLAITLGDAEIETGSRSSTRGSFGSSTGGSFGGATVSGYSVPALATGAVVPPNREFMAILGDNKTETEIVSPLSTMKQAVLEALRESGGLGGGTVTVVVNLDGKEVARNQVKHINDMTRQAGKPVLLY